ncbi:MAG: alpha/beta hydrolase [Chloroflexi bacterium]|nr:alpha/beta hydrolase [Chloroflexota bacterium]
MTHGSLVQEKNVMLNGLRFYYRDWPNDAAPVLVILPGLSETAHSWDSFARAMQDRFRVLVLDQRGHGRTEWATDYRIERWVEDIDAFALALQLPSFALLGHSMGGRNAWFYMAAHPEAVTKLIIGDIAPQIGPGILPAGTTSDDVPEHKVFNNVESAIQERQAHSPTVGPEEIRSTGLANLIQRADGHWTYRWDPILMSPSLSKRYPGAGAEWAALRKIACPTLLVLASETEIEPETSGRMAAEMANCQIVTIPNCGHYLQGENLSGLVSAVRSFLQV